MLRKRKLIASRIDYLDPLNCGSTIGYTIINGRSGLYADVDLTDCNRRLSWSFNNKPEAIKKIDKAISILTEFRVLFLAARAKNKPRRRKRA